MLGKRLSRQSITNVGAASAAKPVIHEIAAMSVISLLPASRLTPLLQ
jgi:hypothetical protein